MHNFNNNTNNFRYRLVYNTSTTLFKLRSNIYKLSSNGYKIYGQCKHRSIAKYEVCNYSNKLCTASNNASIAYSVINVANNSPPVASPQPSPKEREIKPMNYLH
jgi:hypothetical protein